MSAAGLILLKYDPRSVKLLLWGFDGCNPVMSDDHLTSLLN